MSSEKIPDEIKRMRRGRLLPLGQDADVTTLDPSEVLRAQKRREQDLGGQEDGG